MFATFKKQKKYHFYYPNLSISEMTMSPAIPTRVIENIIA